MKHHFRTECPRCGKIDEITLEGHTAAPEFKCGDCLWNDTEVVALKVTPLRGPSRYELAFEAAGERGEA
jgi:hypothetical protein